MQMRRFAEITAKSGEERSEKGEGGTEVSKRRRKRGGARISKKTGAD
jgi:hypothetical protein